VVFVLAVVVVEVDPDAVVDAAAVGRCFAAGTGDPLVVALFALIAGIALLAVMRGRTDPVIAASVAVTFGGFGAIVAAAWAFTVDPAFVWGLTAVDLLAYHRWALAVAAAGVAAASAWYATRVV
jgi:hypothetical protein